MLRKFGQHLSRRKPFEAAIQESEGKHLNRVLNALDVTAIGLGTIIGAGIFVLTGVAAKKLAGPGVIFSYVFAGVSCIFSALCYAEFAARAPISGSAYSYAYTVAGELMAWVIGWDLTLEYTVAAATVARGWSGYLVSFFQGLDVSVPKALYAIDIGIAVLDPLSAFILLLLTILLCFGVKDSARFNLILVILTVIVIFMVVIGGLFFVESKNWKPFLPYGVSGIFSGASVVFFSYIGFDAVTTMSEEMKNPHRDLPIGIIGSLVISIILYASVGAVLTLMVPYHLIVEASPVASAFADYGVQWMEVVVSLGAFAALITTILNSMLGQSRIYFSMARDGLLWPIMGKIHEKYKTPVFAQIVTGVFAIILALFFDIDTLAEMVSIGTLLAFSIVCGSVIYLHYSWNDSNNAENVADRDLSLISTKIQHNVLFWLGLQILTLLLVSFAIVRKWHLAAQIIFGIIAIANTAMFYIMLEKIPTSTFSSKLSFVCPFVPIVPLLGLYCNVFMMANLPLLTWVRLLIWLFLGFVIYFTYSIKHSNLHRGGSGSSAFNSSAFLQLEEYPESRKDDSSDDQEDSDEEDYHHNRKKDTFEDFPTLSSLGSHLKDSDNQRVAYGQL